MKINQNKSKMKKATKQEDPITIAQETKFAKILCGNNKKLRDRILKALKKWLGNCFEKKYG